MAIELPTAYTINSFDLQKIIKDVYDLPHDIQQGIYSQDSYIEHDKGFKGDYQFTLDDRRLEDDEVLDYWKKNAHSGLCRDPEDGWQPDISWVLGDLITRGVLPDGNYIIKIWW